MLHRSSDPRPRPRESAHSRRFLSGAKLLLPASPGTRGGPPPCPIWAMAAAWSTDPRQAPRPPAKAHHLDQLLRPRPRVPRCSMRSRPKATPSPRPIQAQAIPYVLAGRDLLGIAQTGTGKTAAFALPILHRLAARAPAAHAARLPRPGPGAHARAGQPDRGELRDVRRAACGLTLHRGLRRGRHAAPAARAMARGVDILVATPGRLVDHIGQRSIRLDRVEVVVLDEVDRMLDIGFIHDIRRVMSHVPRQRQSLFFSATLPKEIAALAAELLQDPPRSASSPVATTVERVEQQVVHVDQAAKKAVLAKLLSGPDVTRAIVFTRTKHRADQVTRHLAGRRHRRRGDPRQQVAEQPRAGARRLQGRHDQGAGRDRHRRARHRRRRSQPRGQLRPTGRARDLRPPHRPHRPRRRGGPAIAFCSADEIANLARHRERSSGSTCPCCRSRATARRRPRPRPSMARTSAASPHAPAARPGRAAATTVVAPIAPALRAEPTVARGSPRQPEPPAAAEPSRPGAGWVEIRGGSRQR